MQSIQPSGRAGAKRSTWPYATIEATCGSREALVATIAQRYGIPEEQAMHWVEDWAEALRANRGRTADAA